jgi:hypothetical protein
MPRNQQTLNSQTRVLDTVAGRILCIADLRGRLSNVNDLAREVNAKMVIHTGDFGFFGMCKVLLSQISRYHAREASAIIVLR